MNNLVVQLLLKTGTFSSDLKQARGQIQNFQQGCSTAGKSLDAFGKGIGINIGALTKLGGAVGVAVLAGKEFKAIMDSNQTSADAFQGVIAGCTGVLQTFNQALATADFSYFRDGLWSVFEAAKAARDALDDLQDASLAFGYKSKKNQTGFQEAYNIFKDPTATQAMKDDAVKQMKAAVDAQKEYANVYGKKQMDAYVASVVKEAGSANITAKDITGAQFERAMDIKLGLEGDTKAVEAALDSQYKDFQRKMREYGKNNVAAQAELKRQYADVIAVRAMVKGMSDDELKSVVEIQAGMEEAKQSALSMEKTMNRAVSQTMKNTGGSTVKKTLKEEIEIQEESLAYWQRIQREAQTHRDAQVYNSESWTAYNTVLNNALDKIKEINTATETAIRRQREAAKGLLETVTPNQALQPQAVSDTSIGIDGKVIETKKSVNEIQNLIGVLEKLRDSLKEGDPMIETYNKRIEELGKKVEGIKSAGVETPKVSKETVSSWDSFNTAMASTSTIVSSLSQTFKEGTELTAASVLSMVSTALPAIGSLIAAIDALTVTEAVEAGVGAVSKAVSTSKHWIEAIAAVASLGAVVAAAIAAARSNTGKKYATGGIVGGNSYTGDRVTANVNSGEMILTKSQQARLFRLANGGQEGGRSVEFHVSGTELVGVLNNINRKNRITR